MQYSAGMVSRLFWFNESRKIARLMEQGMSKEAIRELCLQENLFQVAAPYRTIEIINGAYRRLDKLDKFLLHTVAEGDISSAKQTLLYAVMRSDRLFFEFMHDVFRGKIILGDLFLQDKDINNFLTAKAEQYEEIAAWSEATMTKLRQCYWKVLQEAGLVIRQAGKGTLQVPVVVPELGQHFAQNGQSEYLVALTGVHNHE